MTAPTNKWSTEAEIENALCVAFVHGARWWEWKLRGATMWQSDQDDAANAAQKRIDRCTLGVNEWEKMRPDNTSFNWRKPWGWKRAHAVEENSYTALCGKVATGESPSAAWNGNRTYAQDCGVCDARAQKLKIWVHR